MTDIYYHKNSFVSIAENWEELNSKQYLSVIKLLQEGLTNKILANEKVTKILCGKSLWRYLQIPKEKRIQFHVYVQWIFDSKEKITKQFIPVYKKWYGPESDFDNLQMAEFHHCEIAFNKIINEEDLADAVNELCAILYRPAKTAYNIKRNIDGDVRQAFNYGEVDWNKKETARWPAHIKEGIVMWYDGCREQLRHLYPDAFSAGESSADNYYDGLFLTIRSLAGNRYGDFEKVEKMNVHTAFLEIVTSIKESHELEAKTQQL